ncbi:LLM class flavin-dependent oxidoreductase, partial [Nocardia salmonicida]|uniref:LLM class flavin-dependent oxidoreductase n=1 Tax=Nocardia salmonicida TaxID=53431 RepID=UPI003646F036
MKFLLMTLITRVPDPVTGVVPSTRDRLREVIEQARRAEEFGYDGFAVGERHEDPWRPGSPRSRRPPRPGATPTRRNGPGGAGCGRT